MTKSKVRRWSEQDDEILAAMVGKTTHRQIAEKLGRTPQAVTFRVKQKGLSKSKHPAQPMPETKQDDFCLNEITLSFLENAIRNGYTIKIPEMGIELRSVNGHG